MTLVVVGSSPTIYPLQNIKNIDFLKKIDFKKIGFNYDFLERNETILSYKNFYNFNIKLLYYYYYLNNSTIINNNDQTNLFLENYYIILNKKKNHYFMSVIKNKNLISTISLGTMLVYFKFTKKCLRRSQKGFNIFTNTFREFYKKHNYENINILINFIDQNFIIFKKNFFKGIKNNNLYFFKFNLPFNTLNFKKYKNIRRRLKKKFLKKFLI